MNLVSVTNRERKGEGEEAGEKEGGRGRQTERVSEREKEIEKEGRKGTVTSHTPVILPSGLGFNLLKMESYLA